MESLTIITACSRPENLLKLWETIPSGCQWIVVFDRPNLDEAPPPLKAAPNVELYTRMGGGAWGNPQKNFGLARARKPYVYFLDDDNILHPALPGVLAAHQSTGQVIVVNQLNANGVRRLTAAPPVRVRRIDTGQVLVPRNLAARYAWSPRSKFADGIYFVRLYRNHTARFMFLDVDAAYYNYLRPGTSSPERVGRSRE